MTMISGVSVVIPAYNEAASLPETVSSALEGLRQLAVDFELIVVDDGSSDGTARIIGELAVSDSRVRAVILPENQGKGAALRAGIALAHKEWVLFLDADGQVPFAEARELLAPAGEDDLIVGCRTSRPPTVVRRIMSRTYNRLMALILGIRVRDIGCPCKLFRRSLLDRIDLRSRGLLLDAELLYCAASAGARIREVPVKGHPRSGGRSTVRLRHVFEILAELFLLVRRTRREGARR